MSHFDFYINKEKFQEIEKKKLRYLIFFSIFKLSIMSKFNINYSACIRY